MKTIRSYPVFKMVLGLTMFIIISSLGFLDNCTVFTASVGDSVLFGNNEDVGYKNATVWFVPATEKTHGFAYFGFHDYPIPNGHFPMGGMNEKGLCFDITSVPETMIPLPETTEEALQFIENYNKYFSMISLNGGVFGEKILETCASVEEAIELIEQYPLLFYGDYQYLFADRHGDSIVLSPGPDGKMEIVRKEGIYQVITNFNIITPELGQYPCRRYENAELMLKKIEDEDDLTAEFFTSILERTSSGGTTYSTIYDLVKGKIYLYNHHKFNWVVKFDLEDELEEGYHYYEVASILRERGGTPSEILIESSKPPLIIFCGLLISVLVFVVTGIFWKRKKNKKM
jgi:hypothetical protein